MSPQFSFLHRFYAVVRFLFLTIFLYIHASQVCSAKPYNKTHSVLYINSYNVGMPWTDSITKGILQNLKQFENTKLYVEYIDSKRFDGSQYYSDLFLTYQKKYRHKHFDLVIVSDNEALNFMKIYGDSLIPNVPVLFCGLVNSSDYGFNSGRYYGIKEGIDLDDYVNVITQVLPNAKKIVFIGDKSPTVQNYFNTIKSFENKYKKRVSFQFESDILVDSLLFEVSNFRKSSAVVLFDISLDKNNEPINYESLATKIAKIAKSPVFCSNENIIAKGFFGGALRSGFQQGQDVANLAINFLKNPDFKPKERFLQSKSIYVFNYEKINEYEVNELMLPQNALILNSPHAIMLKYAKYMTLLIFGLAFLLVIIFFLLFNVRKRMSADKQYKKNLLECQEKLQTIEKKYKKTNLMNVDLGKINNELIQTNKKLLEGKTKAEESNRMKSAFLANVSHEIRTPLNSIIGFSNLMKMSKLEPQEKEYLNYISKGGEAMLYLVDDIIDISKIDVDKLSITQRDVNVKHFFTDFYDYYNSLKAFKDKGHIELILDIDQSNSDFSIFTDEARLKQILTNLTDNAFKYTEQGYVKIGYSISSELCNFFVKDSGIGIPADKHDVIFQRYTQLEHSLVQPSDGAGLGLSIVKKLLNLLGGKIWLESKPGEGTSFYFTLPIK
jgi:signal transduction histidine kinase